MYEGGSETTAFLLTTAVHRLLEQPVAERDRILAEPGRLESFIEEVLRHSTVTHLRARRATEDAVIDGVRIPAGDRVLAVKIGRAHV